MSALPFSNDRSYEIDSIAYLNRARRCLDQQTEEGLFHAAFELRCGTESRLQQYLDAWTDIARHKKQGWRIVDSSQELDRRIRLGDTIYEAGVLDQSGNSLFLYYTPITARLRQSAGGRLHDLSHAMKTYYPSDDGWWGDTRRFLEQIYSDLTFASLGTLLAPIMVSPDRKTSHICAYVRKDTPIAEKVALFSQEGNMVTLKVRYLKALPDYATPFLNCIDS